MNTIHPTRSKSDNKPQKVYLTKEGELIEAWSMGEASRLIGCSSSQISKYHASCTPISGISVPPSSLTQRERMGAPSASSDAS